ncbi:MAG: hypothetical protein EKK34_06725 [Mycobacterium sp.]|nr:MAG: hypothetical protein EKK34_06725 [Mycobacterium sp.]
MIPAAQIRQPAGGTGGLGLRHQGRQQQLQTRLRSICRRATSATRRFELAAITGAILPWMHTTRASRSNFFSR